MKKHIFLSIVAAVAILAPLAVTPAHALSCLPVDMYLKDIIGKEEITIFIGSAKDQIEEDDYTAEVINIAEVLQGYAEDELMVYHEKNADWGYLCNAGPGDENERGLYITERNAHGKYNVYQRLELTDPLVETLKEDLEEAEIEGALAETTKEDRLNQIRTTIAELMEEIQILIQEFRYWISA